MSSVKQQIEDRLTAALSPQSLVITDDSALHAGHSEQAKAGESHFTVEIVSSAFEGQARVQRQVGPPRALSLPLAKFRRQWPLAPHGLFNRSAAAIRIWCHER